MESIVLNVCHVNNLIKNIFGIANISHHQASNIERVWRTPKDKCISKVQNVRECSQRKLRTVLITSSYTTINYLHI